MSDRKNTGLNSCFKNKILNPSSLLDFVNIHGVKPGKKGMTLLEILIVLGILAIITLMAFSLYMFGSKVFAKGDNQAETQFDVRMTADRITKEIRFSTEVEILKASDTIPGTVTTDECYIFAGTAGGIKSIIYRDKNGDRTITHGITGDLLFETASPNNTLYFNISGTYKGQNFNIDSEVLVLNLREGETIIDNTGTDDGVAVRFKKILAAAAGGLSIDSPAPLHGFKDTAYSHTFSASGGTTPYSFSITSGTLPQGLTMSSTGLLSGTPSKLETTVFTVTVTDSSTPQKWCTRAYGLTIYDNTLAASGIASDITSGTILFPNIVTNDTNLVLPTVPANYRVEIYSSDTPVVIAADGTITPPAVDTQVTLVLKVTNIFDALDSALTGSITVTVPAASSNLAPVAAGVQISGTARVGVTLTGNYSYSDNENDPESGSIIKWYRGDRDDGSGITEISAGLTYTPGTEDASKYLYFEVTPCADSGTSPGKAVLSAPVLVETGNTAPTALNVTITGEQREGYTLQADYTFDDSEGDLEGNSTYKWYRSTKNNGSDKTEIPGAISKAYQLTQEDEGKYICFEVTPVALSGVIEGDAVLSANVGKIRQ